jgi:hypothetical protein
MTQWVWNVLDTRSINSDTSMYLMQMQKNDTGG